MKRSKHSNEEIRKDESREMDEAEKTVGEVPKSGAAESASEGENSNEIDALRIKLDEMTRQSEENYGKFVRMQADFDNFRKRVIKEKEEIFTTSLEKIMKEVLPVVDNLERAIVAFRTDDLDAKYVDGVDMVFKQLFAVLEKNGLKEIEAEGKAFDPNIHHAVMQAPAEGVEENTIVEVFQKGYILGSRVIRPSMVKVSCS